MNKPMTFLDFFSGVGGFRKGFELCGMVCKGHCEIDKFADRSYRAIHDISRHRSIPAYFRTVFVSEFPQNELDDPWCSPLGQVIQGSVPGNHHGTYSFGNPCGLVWHMCCNCAF